MQDLNKYHEPAYKVGTFYLYSPFYEISKYPILLALFNASATMSHQTENFELHHRRHDNYNEVPTDFPHEPNAEAFRRAAPATQNQQSQVAYIPISEDDSSNDNSRVDKITEIVRHMEQDDALMQDNPVSEQLRK